MSGYRLEVKGKSALVILELLAFNAPNFTGSHDPGHAPFYPFLTFGGWRPPSNIV